MYYIAHRLFSMQDRALATLIAQSLEARVGAGGVFLPFCDTDEEELVSDCKGRRLYDLDCARLRHLSGMIAVLHGPSIDDGVCMEIGFARQLEAPTVVFTTDFQTYGLAANSPELGFPDPLIEAIVQTVVRAHRLAPSPTEGDRYQRFLLKNLLPLTAGIDTVCDLLLMKAQSASQSKPKEPGHPRTAFIEPSPYYRSDWVELTSVELSKAGWTVEVAKRWEWSVDMKRQDILTRALADWELATSSEMLVVDVNGPETPPGAAALIGAFVAARRRILAYSTSEMHTFAAGREPNFRNLMIQYAIADRFSSTAALREFSR